MIETKSKKLNVKELSVFEPKTEKPVPFDAELELTKEEWRNVMTFTEWFGPRATSSDWAGNFFDSAARLKIISPSRFRKLDLNNNGFGKEWSEQILKDEAEEWFDKYLDRKNKKLGLLGYFKVYSYVPLWAPERANELRSNTENLKEIKQIVHAEFSTQNYSEEHKLKKLLFLKILYPDEFEDFEAGQYFRDKRYGPQEATANWQIDMVPFIAMLRLVCPEVAANIEIPKEVWEEWINRLHSIDSKENTKQFLEYATSLAILAAKKLEVGVEGVKLVNKEIEDLDDKYIVPVLRRF